MNINNNNSEELLNKIKYSCGNGNIITSLFIHNDDKKYNTIVIEKMWNYFTLNNKEFMNLFSIPKSIKILPGVVKSKILLALEINENEQKQYMDIYKKVFEPIFLGFINNLKNKNYCQLLFSFNNISISNICIVYYNNQFFIVKIINNTISVDKMNDMLINLNQYGCYIHVLITF